MAVALSGNEGMDRPYINLKPKTLRLDWTMSSGVAPPEDPFLHIWLSTGCGDEASRYRAVQSVQSLRH